MTGSPAEISAGDRVPSDHFASNANGGNSGDALNDTPGGVVSAPVDVDGWDPDAPKNAAARKDNNTPSSDDNADHAEVEYVMGPPPPPPPPPSSPEGSDKPAEPVVCGPENGWSRFHTVTLSWKDGIAIEWWKEEGITYPEKMKKALLSHFDALIKGRPVQRTDLCTAKPPYNMELQVTKSIAFKDVSKVMPSVLDAEVTFNSQEEFAEFLSHTEIASAWRLPGHHDDPPPTF